MREPSHLRATVKLVMHALRARGREGDVHRAVPRRRLAVERRGIEVDPKRIGSYLRVTGEPGVAGDPRGERAVVPPTYPALWETALALEVLTQAELPLPTRGLIHMESEMVHLRPLHLSDRVRCRVELDRVDEHPQGLRLTLVSRNWNGSGQLCLEDRLVLLARLKDASGRRVPREEAGESAAKPAAEWREVRTWELRSNHGRRYAVVSGDINPIHLWSWSSRLFGFHRPVLHGFCMEAMVAHALIQHHLGGDPAALRRLQIRFRSPLLLPARVRLQTAPKSPRGGRLFRLLREDGGERPLAEGEFVGAE